MNREVDFIEDAICDRCGTQGAYDFYGDYLCSVCAGVIIEDDNGEDDF